MWHIVVVILLFAPPDWHVMLSKQTFETKQACEVQAPIDAAKWEGVLASVRHTLDAQCMTKEQAMKLDHDLRQKIQGDKGKDDSI